MVQLGYGGIGLALGRVELGWVRLGWVGLGAEAKAEIESEL